MWHLQCRNADKQTDSDSFFSPDFGRNQQILHYISSTTRSEELYSEFALRCSFPTPRSTPSSIDDCDMLALLVAGPAAREGRAACLRF